MRFRASAAVQTLNPPPASPSRGGGRAPRKATTKNGYEVFVKYLPHETSESEVGAFFAENFGPLKGDVRLIRDQSGRCKGAGFVTFASEIYIARRVSYINGTAPRRAATSA